MLIAESLTPCSLTRRAAVRYDPLGCWTVRLRPSADFYTDSHPRASDLTGLF